MSSVSIHETMEAVSPNPGGLTREELQDGARLIREYVEKYTGEQAQYSFSDPMYITHAHGRSIVSNYTFNITRHWEMDGDFMIGGDAGEVFNVDKHFRKAVDSLYQIHADDFDIEDDPEDD